MAIQNVQVAREYVSPYIADFFLKLETDGSEKTAKDYKRYISKFIQDTYSYSYQFLTKEHLNLITLDTLIDYKNKMYLSKKYKNTTINTHLSGIREFLRYMKARKQYIHDVSDLEFLNNLRDDTEHYDTIDMNMAQAIIEDIQKNDKRLTNEKVWFIKIAIETGLRTTNILNLKKSQFHKIPNIPYVMIRSTKENMGKRNEHWEEKIHEKFYNEIVEGLFKDDSEHLFTMSKCGSTMLKALHRSIERLGYQGNYVLHSFKRTAINNTRDFTGDIYASQEKGKHKNPTTTINNYMDKMKYGATGYYSMQYKLEENILENASKEIILKAIDKLDENVKMLIEAQILNMKGEL